VDLRCFIRAWEQFWGDRLAKHLQKIMQNPVTGKIFINYKFL